MPKYKLLGVMVYFIDFCINYLDTMKFHKEGKGTLLTVLLAITNLPGFFVLANKKLNLR